MNNFISINNYYIRLNSIISLKIHLNETTHLYRIIIQTIDGNYDDIGLEFQKYEEAEKWLIKFMYKISSNENNLLSIIRD